jgi:sulfate adenylyltransferase subunit 1 (EFTu-like GTPase family)
MHDINTALAAARSHRLPLQRRLEAEAIAIMQEVVAEFKTQPIRSPVPSNQTPPPSNDIVAKMEAACVSKTQSRFIDTDEARPEHEQYTRNMTTGASNAELAVILIDARKGLPVHTKPHSFICSLLCIRHVVVAVNKIDLVDYSKDGFDRIVTFDGDAESAETGDAVTLRLADEIDVACGDVLVGATPPPEGANQFAAHFIWMDHDPLMLGRTYLVRTGTKTVAASITAIKYKIDVDTREHVAAYTLGLNDIAFCNVSVASPVVFNVMQKTPRPAPSSSSTATRTARLSPT